jgi:type II secretory pathway component PulF
MRLFFPKANRQWSQFYFKLSQLTKSGITPADALSELATHGDSEEIKGICLYLAKNLTAGNTLAQSLKSMGNTLGHRIPALDLALLVAGELSGRLEEIYNKLGDYYLQIAELKSKAIVLLLYPLGLLHLGLLIFPSSHLVQLVSQGPFPFLRAKFFSFGLLWLILSFPYFALGPNSSIEIKKALNLFLDKIPILGTARKNASLARFCLALESMTAAGMTPIDSWPLSAQASDNIEIQIFVLKNKNRIKEGIEISRLLSAEAPFPQDFMSQFRIAEKTGQIESTLKRLAADYERQAKAQYKNISNLLPRIVYILVVLYSAISIFKELSSAVDKIKIENLE